MDWGDAYWVRAVVLYHHAIMVRGEMEMIFSSIHYGKSHPNHRKKPPMLRKKFATIHNALS